MFYNKSYMLIVLMIILGEGGGIPVRSPALYTSLKIYIKILLVEQCEYM